MLNSTKIDDFLLLLVIIIRRKKQILNRIKHLAQFPC